MSPPPAPAPPQLPVAGETSGWGAPADASPVVEPVAPPAPPVGIAPPPGGLTARQPTNAFLFTGLPIASEIPSPQVVAPPPPVAESPIAPPPVVQPPVVPAAVVAHAAPTAEAAPEGAVPFVATRSEHRAEPEPEQEQGRAPAEPEPAPAQPEPAAAQPEPAPAQPEPAPADPEPEASRAPVLDTPAPTPDTPDTADTADPYATPDDENDDETDDENDDENDATVVSDRRSATGWRIVLDGGAQQGVGGQVLVGRQVKAADPRWPAARLLSVADTTKSVSKVHALLEADAANFWVTDLGSTNGVIIALPNGSELVLAAGVRGDVPAGSDLVLGNYVITVEKD